MTTIQPWIRKYNYIEEYYKTLYKIYANTYRGYPVTYYSIDEENTIWDDRTVRSGSYEAFGVGELSGVKWKRIENLPVFGLEEVQPNSSSNEKGLHYSEGTETRAHISQKFGIKPKPNDVLDLSFGYQTKSIKMEPLYIVRDFHLAHTDNFDNVYQLSLGIAPFKRNDLEKQLSNYFQYLDQTQKIHPINTAKFLLKMEKRMDTLKDRIDDLFNQSAGVFLELKKD